MKQIGVLVGILTLVFMLVPLAAYAHSEKTQGSITVELHIDPDENPNPGSLTHIYELINDRAKQFQLNHCDCRITIVEGKNTLLSQQFPQEKLQSSVYTTEIPFTFPEYDLYHITVTGKPLKGYNFQSFAFSWDFRVDPDTPGFVTGLSDVQIIMLALAAIIVFFILFGFFLKREILDKEEIDIDNKRRQTKK